MQILRLQTLILNLLFIFASIHSQTAALATELPLNCHLQDSCRASEVLREAQNQCHMNWKVHQCDEFILQHPEAKAAKTLNDCDEITSCSEDASLSGELEKCMSGWKGAWVDEGKGAWNFLVHGVSLDQRTLDREDFFQKCISPECKKQMLGEFTFYFQPEEISGHTQNGVCKDSSGHILNPKDIVAKNWCQGFSAAVLYRQLLIRLKNQPQLQSLDRKDFIEPWSGEKAELPLSFNDLIDKKLEEVGIKNSSCFKPEVVWQMRCYALFSIVDPLLVAGAGVGILKIAGILGRSEELAFSSAAERAATRAKAERYIGPVTDTQAEGIYKAHLVGTDQHGRPLPGRDGTPARVGNYTDQQIAEKARLLKAYDISREDRRTLMEKKVVGLDPTSDSFSSAVPIERGSLTPAIQTLNMERRVPVTMAEFRDAYVANNFQGDAAYIIYSKAGSTSRDIAKILEKRADGSLVAETLDSNNNRVSIILKPEDLLTARLSQSSAEAYKAIEPKVPGPVIGQQVVAINAAGEKSVASVQQILANGKVIITSGEGSTSTVSLSQIKYNIPKPLLPPTDAQILNFNKTLNEVARVDQAGAGYYHGDGYFRQYTLRNEGPLPQQGWKLHVGANTDSAARIAEVLGPELEKRQISFKLVQDLAAYSSKKSSNPLSGKFITIYPRSAEEAGQIAKVVDQILKAKGFTEKDFLKTNGEASVGLGTTARFGRLSRGELVDPKTGKIIPGTDGDMLLGPDGRPQPDVRGVTAPAWVPFPFSSEP